MSGDFSVQASAVLYVVIIGVLIAFLVLLVKVISLIVEITTTVKQSQTTIRQVDELLVDVVKSVKHVEPIVEDVNAKYFAASNSAAKASNNVSQFFASLKSKFQRGE